MIQQGFAALGLTSINSNHLTRNPASHRVMEKRDMRTEGVLRRRFRKSGRPRGHLPPSILREEWAG